MKMIVLLLLISQHASGVEVYEGAESVLLPCRVQTDVSRNSTAAVWRRDEFSNPTVHLRRQKSDNLDEHDDLNVTSLNDLYKHRTSMFTDALQTGDLSLTLRNPTVSDSGTYTCITRRAGEDLSKTEVQLKVSEPPPVWPKVLAAVLVTLIILAAASGLFVYRLSIKKKSREALQPEVVEATQEQESVLLPCKTTDVLRKDVTVAWTCSDHNNMKVHVYESGNNQPVKQDQGYKGRAEMDEDQLRTGDFSLTLKDLRLTDSGVYTCSVYKDGHMLIQKVVILRVRALQPEVKEVTQGQESVLLPCKTTAGLPQDVTVEWRLTEPNNMKVHVYESGNNQPNKQHQRYRGRTEMTEDPLRAKDFSLTLKNIRPTDRGVYTCNVNKDGHTLLQKVVTLSFKVNPVVALEMSQEDESVLLPCKTTAVLPQDVTVEWTRSDYNDMKVHVYESGKNQPDKQNQDYRGRTEMDEDPLNTKDLSLTLKGLWFTDRGRYTCRVYNKDGHMLLQKSVILHVKEYQNEVVEENQGKSVKLPFNIPPVLPHDVTVEWTDSNNMEVHVYKSGNNQPGKQHQSYRGHTEMDEDPLKTGDLSLTLKHLHLTDSGVYTCTVYNKDGDMLVRKSVQLSVRALQPEVKEVSQGEKSVQLPFQTTADLPQDITVEWKHEDKNVPQDRTEMKKDPLRTGDFSLTLKDLRLTDSGVYTCRVYNKDGEELLQKSVQLSFKLVALEMSQEDESVLLPCKTTAVLPQDVTVAWTRSDYNDMKVHMYESGKNQPDKQNQDYRGRTEMDEDPLRNKDLSLTLKHLRLTDSGVYTCTVYKDGEEVLQKSVQLRVRDVEMQMVVTQGLKFVILPFKISHDLPQDVTVEWRHNIVTVYKYTGVNIDLQHQGYRRGTEMDEDPLRTKDLSLTLKDLRLTDSGVYTCRVYNKDGHMLLQKVVTLSVRDFQVEMVKETEGAESVQLPFKTTAVLPQDVTVEWRLTEPNNMKVHVYESGKHHPDEQHQDYRGRTEMKGDPLRNKDLSLTLKDIRPTDSGVYTCTVEKHGHMLLQKSVILRVTATLKATMAEMLLHHLCSRHRRAQPDQEHRNRNHEDVPLMEVHSA